MKVKIFSCLRFLSSKFHLAKNGQIAVLYALLVPMFVLLLGLTFDLGWYYLNVSRLQNAADSAAVAGAQTIIQDKNFSNYKSVSLIGKVKMQEENEYTPEDPAAKAIEDSNSVAADYAAKNLSNGIGWLPNGNEYILTDAWSKNEVTMNPAIYKYDDNLYYVVRLKEDIQHFFLPGWFDAMTAPVTAVAMLSNTNSNSSRVLPAADSGKPQPVPGKPTPVAQEVEVEEEVIEVFEELKNKNVIVGNWEIQNYYKNLNEKETDGNGNPIATKFYQIYGFYLYSDNWNHFQDIKNHYDKSNPTYYRWETVKIFDDVVDTDNDKLADKWGKNSQGSSVVDTKASSNTGGKPYLASQLDSINIDFKPEVGFNKESTYAKNESDWDLRLGFTDYVKSTDDKKDWGNNAETSITKNIDNLRIHSSINFEDPYPERNDKITTENPTDILWARIESEPMFFHPDSVNGKAGNMTDFQAGLSSVRQIIINANKSNYNEGGQKYRPVVMFYDGPEAYDTNADIRASQPVILNLNAPFRGVLYAPNSPVIIVGSEQNKNAFRGFVIAKSYMRLKTTADFKAESNLYTSDSSEYAYTRKDAVDNPYYNPNKSTSGENYNKEPDTIQWTYTRITENGIEMYVDNYGNVQYVDYSDAPKSYGLYDNFGRTDFSTHGYTVAVYSDTNMFTSGK